MNTGTKTDFQKKTSKGQIIWHITEEKGEKTIKKCEGSLRELQYTVKQTNPL